MYRSLFTLLLLVSSWSLTAQELVPVFGPVVPVTPTNTTGSMRPRIVLVQDSVPLVMWTKIGSGNGIVYAARWNGTGFDPAVQVSPSGLNVYTSPDEGGNIAARGDTAFIVFFTTDSRTFSVRSIDGGITWGDTVRIDHQLPGDMAYTPDVHIYPGGNPIVLFEAADMTMTQTRQKVCRSQDGGQTFSMEQDAHLSLSGIPCECCPPALLVNDSMVYVLYRNNDNNLRNIVMTLSSDSGMTFAANSEFDQTNWTISSCPTAGPEAMFYHDSILAVWKSSNKIYYGTGHALNGTEGAHVLLEPSLSASVLQRQPSICGNGDTVVYTWNDRRTSNYDVYVAISASGPQELDTVFMFNDTTGTAENGTQQTPHAVYRNGTIHLVYQDLGAGKVMYRMATPAGVVSVPEPAEEILIANYPNPVTDGFILTAPSGLNSCVAKIYSMDGRLISTTPVNQTATRIDCSTLAIGSYLLEVSHADGTLFTTTILKQ